MTTNLYICVKNPFTERDFNRMGIAELSDHFNLKILDCTRWLLPKAFKTRGNAVFNHSSRVEIGTLRDLFREIKSNGGYVLDFVGQFSPKAILMFSVFGIKGVRIVVVDSGAYPVPDIFVSPRSGLQKILEALKHGGIMLHIWARVNQLLLKIVPNQKPYIAFVSGSAWKTEPRFLGAQKKILIHSFDYEVYRSQKKSDKNLIEYTANPYAVYLDEDITGHEDNIEMGLTSPATAEKYYPALRHFFDSYELISGQKILIAGYPGRRLQSLNPFGGREVRYQQTAELIKNSTLVFAHASTAISFAVLWKKPIIFLTSNQIEKSWYQPWVDAPRLLLKSQLINIDKICSLRPDLQKIIDVGSYCHYEECFIKSVDSPDLPLWEIVTNTLLNEKP